MSGTGNVGTASVYEAGDQRNVPDSEKPENQNTPYEEGKQGSHQANDPSTFPSNSQYIDKLTDNHLEDERSIGNRLAAANPQNDDTSGKNKTAEQIAGESDPTAPARMHGNEPSKGAKIDKKIEDEEADLIAKMDAKKAAKKS